MKKQIHPSYQKVLFVDSASGHRFVCGSTLQPEAREMFEGVEYPVSYLSVSSSSHPLFTGSRQLVDAEGRVEKFKRRFERKKEAANEESASEGEKEGKPQLAPSPKAAQKKVAKTPKKGTTSKS
jgi:large subunit ribosomal protein L31